MSQNYYDYDAGFYFNNYQVESVKEEGDIVTFHTDARYNRYQYQDYVTLKFEWNKTTNTIELICMNNFMSYTGKWVMRVEEDDYYADNALYSMIMWPLTLGQGQQLDDEVVIATQTLFNNDEKWEFIRAINKETIDEDYYYDNEQDRDGDGEFDYKRTKYTNQVVGYEIVSEDGYVLASLDVEENDGCDLAVIIWDEDVYLAVRIEKETYNDFGRNEFYMVIYTIDKNTTSISRVNATAPAMRVSPVLATRNSTINITLDGEAAERGGELIITDGSGRAIGHNRVAAGQTSVAISTDRMSSGTYNITLTEKGEKIENARIIVK